MEIWQILTLVFGILSAFFGFYWTKAKTTIDEIGILFNIISEALKDDTLTKEELQLIVTQLQEILHSFRVKGTIDEKAKDEILTKVKSISSKKK